MTNKLDITASIKALRTHYIATGKADSYFSINCGDCDAFALDLINALGGSTDELFDVETLNFCVEGSNDEGYARFDFALIESNASVHPKGCLGVILTVPSLLMRPTSG